MSDIFISYARSTAAQAAQIGEALRALGYAVWRDDELPAHRAYSEVIEERLAQAKAVVVVWSDEATKSQWVRAEADIARGAGKLVQLSLDGAVPPIPFNQIQCADLGGWAGDAEAPGWRKVTASIADLVGAGGATSRGARPDVDANAPRVSICVLPFDNISGDPEQAYFSDGITEDIITDLSKVSALWVAARNTAFTFKGKSVDVTQVARQLKVSHVLEGSVRKAGERVRITAQLIEGATGGHVWAERYDRDLNDIFALQDEISEAIVAALKLKLLPEEKQAIEQRGTHSPEAYKLYLMARQFLAGGAERHQAVAVRLCRKMVEIDPSYARAWALLSLQLYAMHSRGTSKIDGREAADRALALDPALADAHVARAVGLFADGEYTQALEAGARALELDPKNAEAHTRAGWCCLALHRYHDAIAHYERAIALNPAFLQPSGMVIQAYSAIGDEEGARVAARRNLAQVEKIIAAEPDHGTALGFGVGDLVLLGEVDRAREWAARAALLDPENVTLQYNLASAMALIGAADDAVEFLEGIIGAISPSLLRWMDEDSDFDPIREHPSFVALMAKGRGRLEALEVEVAQP